MPTISTKRQSHIVYTAPQISSEDHVYSHKR